MSHETPQESLMLPAKPEYPSPFFSYKMVSPKTVKTLLERLSQGFDPRENVMVRLGPPSDGPIETPVVNLKDLRNNHYRHELYIPINLPRTFHQDFINYERSIFSSKGRRMLSLERDLKSYVDKKGMHAYVGNERTEINRTRDSTHDMLADIWRSGSKHWMRYMMLPDIFNSDSPINQAFFESEVRDAVTIASIYFTHILKFNKVSFPHSVIRIDPQEFQIIERPGIDLLSMTPEELRRGVTRAVLNLPDSPLDQPKNGITIDDNGKIIYTENVDQVINQALTKGGQSQDTSEEERRIQVLNSLTPAQKGMFLDLYQAHDSLTETGITSLEKQLRQERFSIIRKLCIVAGIPENYLNFR